MSVYRALRPLIVAPLIAFAAWQASAACVGTNLIEALGPDDSAALDAAVAAQPYAEGNLWRATRDGQVLTILGTYHLSHPGHQAITDRIAPLLDAAKILLVEASPADADALKDHIARDPSLLFLSDGPSLVEQFSPEDWAQISRALAARNMPAVMGAKMRPWYLASILAIPPCSMAAAIEENGLDHRVMDMAEARGLPIRSLEPYTTLFRIFDQLSDEQQLDMLKSSLLMEDQVSDYSITMEDAFFAEDTRRTWEFLRLVSADLPGYDRARADAEFALMERVLMDERNHAWIAGIEEAAKNGRVFIAFGALHLAGKEGVLNLLAQNGWQIERLTR